MYIDTYSYENMTRDICKYFNIGKDKLTRFFNSFDSDDYREIEYEIDHFIDMQNTYKKIDQILFFHLTRRLDTDITNSTLNTFDVLTGDSSISKFLKKYYIKLIPTEDQIIEVIQDGKIVSIDDLKNANINYLKGRLGYDKNYIDWCVNGYAFQVNKSNYYYDQLRKCPELISVLCSGLNRDDIVHDYEDNSHYYLYIYCLPIDMVIIDNKTNQNVEEKVHTLIENVLYILYDGWKSGKKSLENPICNPFLRLGENVNVDCKYFVERISLD